MITHILFIVIALTSFSFLGIAFSKIFRIAKMLKKPYSLSNVGQRLKVFFSVAILQKKIMRLPILGFMHSLVFWGFLMITFGSLEMLIDGFAGFPFNANASDDRILSFLGPVYTFIIAGGDISAAIILLAVLVFLFRRLFMNIKRFTGQEMRHKDHKDANIALLFILFLMISLLGMNAGYVAFAEKTNTVAQGAYPISQMFASLLSGMSEHSIHLFEISNWWAHIILIFLFANYLPKSKHFHVFMSLPNVYLSRTEPLTKMNNLESVKAEVELMMNPDAPEPEFDENAEPERFGMKDVTDGTWKNYVDSLTCTQCGRCTSVCPANLTGKKLSPRKVVLDYRRRMEEITQPLLKEGKSYDDGKSLLGDYTTPEELWACTTCNACAQECPVNIDQPSMILDLRRFIFMEESAAPSLLNSMSTNIENNGAPWQYPAADRFNWAKDLKSAESEEIKVPLMSNLAAENKTPEYLFWVGSASSYDDRAKKITQSFVKILDHAKVDFAVLGAEESDSGEVAKRTGNEFLFQMQAAQNIEIMNAYGIKKIVTCDPHEFNTLKNEYPDLGGQYQVIHHTELIAQLTSQGKLKTQSKKFAGKRITFHDPCYLGRGNGVYDAPRKAIENTGGIFTETAKNKSKSLCCGAGGGQLFKEAEPGNQEVYELRTEGLLETKPEIIAAACPLCTLMLTDGLKMKEKEKEVKVLDIAELTAQNLDL